jgi:hypothetical protein
MKSSPVNYFQVIIVLPDKNAPQIYFLKESSVTPEVLEEMEYQTGDYPSWCLEDEDSEVLYKLDDAKRICPIGTEIDPCTITRCFYYCVG